MSWRGWIGCRGGVETEGEGGWEKLDWRDSGEGHFARGGGRFYVPKQCR